VPSLDGRTARVLLVGSRNLIEVRPGAVSQASTTARTPSQPELTLEVDDVDADTAQLKRRGVDVVAEPRMAPGRHARVSVIRDLDGRTIELQEPLRRSQPNPDSQETEIAAGAPLPRNGAFPASGG
jgi:hypothetical protein